jgi:hypothetical protein
MRLASVLLLASLAAACASRTSTVQTAATPQQTAAVTSKPAPSDVFGAVSVEKKKLLATALVSSDGGGCWNAVRHAPIVAETIAEDGTPYIAPIAQKLDLNGDGLADDVIEVDRDGKNVRYELYLNKGNCSRHLGTVKVEGTIRGVMTTASHGMKMLEVIADGDGELKHSELAFDGKTWAVGKRWTTPLK